MPQIGSRPFMAGQWATRQPSSSLNKVDECGIYVLGEAAGRGYPIRSHGESPGSQGDLTRAQQFLRILRESRSIPCAINECPMRYLLAAVTLAFVTAFSLSARA